ncbi:MAG: rhodanese-like domain-containing protein [Saprospiraceae bacterium]|nr:rhodanese-like domain-containing protein [Saprospiraceae bacterium]
MKKAPLFLVLCLMLFAGNIVSAQGKAFQAMLKTLLAHTVPEIDVMTTQALQSKNAFLLDARAAREFEVSHLEHARLVGYDDFSLDRVADIPKDSVIVVYCSVGYRSEKVAEKLIAAGYTRVSNLYGGIFQWVNEEKAVVDKSGQPTEKVHAYNRTWGVWLQKGKKVYR